MKAKEEWLPVEGFPGYEVSNTGLVKRNAHEISTTRKGHSFTYWRKEKILKPYQSEYFQIILTKDGERYSKRVHRLVAEVFLGPQDGMQVNHKDGDKFNNNVENLEWVSPSENVIHSYSTGLASNEGTRHSRAKITEEDVRNVRCLLKYFGPSDVSRMLGVGVKTVSDIKNGKAWTCVV